MGAKDHHLGLSDALQSVHSNDIPQMFPPLSPVSVLLGLLRGHPHTQVPLTAALSASSLQ